MYMVSFQEYDQSAIEIWSYILESNRVISTDDINIDASVKI